jgi:hypothetical protein
MAKKMVRETHPTDIGVLGNLLRNWKFFAGGEMGRETRWEFFPRAPRPGWDQERLVEPGVS